MKRLLIVLALATSCVSQASQQVQTASTTADAKLTPAEIKANQEKARDLLQLAESESRGLDAGMRALTLSQIGSAYVGVDQKKAAALLHDAFTATTEMDPERARDKQFLQDRILNSLLGLEGDAIAELLPRAEPDTRSGMMGRLIARAAEKKDFARAGELVNQAAADSAKFPYDGVTSYMLQLPPDDSSDRLNAFMQAYNAYSRTAKEDTGFSTSGFDRIIVRFGGLLPKEMTLKAIDDVLNRAKDSDSDARFTLSSAAGSATFNTSYDYYLFEFLPVLRKLDPSKADDLLKQDNVLQGTMSRFPNGVASLDPTIRDTPPKHGESGGMSFSINSAGKKSNSAAPSGANMQQIIGQYNAEVSRIAQLAAKEPRQALSEAMNLPESVGTMLARLAGLQAVAQATWQKYPEVSRDALDQLMKAVANLKPESASRSRLTTLAADLYMRLNDTEAAKRTIDLGLKNAEALYDIDNNADDPNKALKGYWPSAALWGQCIALAYKVEPDKVPEMLAGIKDDEIRTFTRIAYALALTGNPYGSVTTMVRRKGQNSTSTYN